MGNKPEKPKKENKRKEAKEIDNIFKNAYKLMDDIEYYSYYTEEIMDEELERKIPLIKLMKISEDYLEKIKKLEDIKENQIESITGRIVKISSVNNVLSAKEYNEIIDVMNQFVKDMEYSLDHFTNMSLHFKNYVKNLQRFSR